MNPTGNNNAGNAPAADPTQAPAPAASSANTPAVAAPTAPSPTPTATPATPASAGDEPMTLEEARKLRRELNAKTARIKEFEDAQAAAEAANMSELQKAQKAAQDAQAEVASYKQRIAALAIEKQAAALGIIDPEVATQLIAAKLEYDKKTGEPTNAEDLLKELLKAKSYLAGQPAGGQQQQQQPSSNASRGNPGRDTSIPGVTFKTSQLADFDFYMKHEAEIKQAMREGRIINDEQ